MQDLIIINALYVYMKLAFFTKGKKNQINLNDSLFDAILSFNKIKILNQLDFVKVSKDSFIKIRTRKVVKLLLFWFDFL